MRALHGTADEKHIVLINTGEFESVCRERLENGGTVALEVTGASMLPFLAGGRDSVVLTASDRPPKRGDILLYRRRNGRLVLHRVCRTRDGGCYMCGDAQTALEGPVSPGQVLARAASAVRKGRRISEGGLCWSFFKHVWRWARPVRPLIIKCRAALAGKRGQS